MMTHQRPLTAGCLLLMTAVYAQAQTVNVWLTTQDRGSKLEPQPPVAFSSGGGGTHAVYVDETRVYQEVEGFGASFTDSAAYLLNQVATPAARAEAMSNLFTRVNDGIGVSFLRNPMGASDLARYHYSYDDQPSGMTDEPLNDFSIAHDRVDIIPLIQEALLLNPQLTIMGSPWSPPGWMKDSGEMIGGSLLPGMYTAYADYFVKYVQAYEAEGIPVDYVTLQNEPLYVPGDYPGMDMDTATQRDVLRDYVLPAFSANSLSTKVLVYDHNWDGSYYPETVLADPVIQASSQVAGTAWHGYGGTPGVMLGLAGRFPTKGNYQTEHSGGAWVGGDANQIATDFKEIIHCMRSEAKAFVKWSLALDQNRGPNAGGCDTCTPLVTVDTITGDVSYPVDYYTLGHFSKFVLPGARRIYSANAAGVVSAAFLNPDGSKALVAFNDSTSSVAFEVRWGGRAFPYALPGYAGATFTWTGSQAGSHVLEIDQPIRASSFSEVSGLLTEATSDLQGGYNLGYAEGDDYAVYSDLGFIPLHTNLSVRAASFGGGTLEFRLGSPGGTLLSSVALPDTGGWQNWQTVTTTTANVSGLHDLCLVFKGSGGGGLGNVNWFQFNGAPPPGPATRLIWTTEPGLATNDQPFAQQPVLKTADQYGIPTSDGLPAILDVKVELTAGTGPLLGTTNVNMGTGGMNGVAAFTDLQINSTGTDKELTASCTSTSAPSGNLLLNGDFNTPASEDPPSEWTTWTGGGVSWANHENKVGVTHDGSYYMVVGGHEGGAGGFHQTVPATPGKTYELSVLSGADTWWLPYGEMRLFFQNAGGGEVGYSSRPTLNPPDYGHEVDIPHPWTPYTLAAEAPPGTAQIKVEFMSHEKGSIWYENAVLAELGSGPPLASATTLPFTVEPAPPPVSRTNYVGDITLNGDGIFDLEFVGTPGVAYYLQSTTNLLPPATWDPVTRTTNVVTNTSGTWALTVTNDGPLGFYRSSAAAGH